MNHDPEQVTLIDAVRRLRGIGWPLPTIEMMLGPADSWPAEALTLPQIEPGPTVEYTVEFTDSHVIVTASHDATVHVSGDVRDNERWRLTAGRARRRALTNEQHGYVAINGVIYETP